MTRFIRARGRWLVLTAVGALLAAFAFPSVGIADNASGCDFAATGTTPSCSGPLTGSTFAGGDGNLIAPGPVTTFGTTDWQNVAGLNPGFDLPSGSGDNAFGQGTKEDNASVSVVSGSIPPNKSDLSRFYEASEFVGSPFNSNFLYLAWERTNVLGSANMDFEINQATTSGLGTPGAHIINRTAGDLLVTFDFTNGGGKPTLSLLFWVTSGSTSQCFSSNSLPCWGGHVTLNGSDSIGAVNNLDAVSDPLFPTSANYINPVPALQFGETAINLTAAGVFPAGSCGTFGSVFLKSRASASFTAEVKDFVAPIPVHISNCGAVTIIKHTDPRGLNQNFSYTSTLAGTSISCITDATPASFTLNDNLNTSADSAANQEICTQVPAGSYTVTEAEPGNFTLESLTCITSGGGSGTQNGTHPLQADITVVPFGLVTCTYVNQVGAILVTKTAKNHNLGGGQHPLAGVTFKVNGVSVVTDANGHACFEGLAIGTPYTVTETAAPTGYSIDTTSQTVTPSAAASCTSGTPTGVTFTDTPLTDVSVSAKSEVAGATNSTITCVDASNVGVGNSPQGPGDPVSVTANGLKPGTYTCTVVIDP